MLPYRHLHKRTLNWTPTPPHPSMVQHPVFTGQQSVGMMSGENAGYPAAEYGHETLKRRLDDMGLKYQETRGKYNGKPERSIIIYGPTRDHMMELGRRFGQDAVIHVAKPNDWRFHYTNGEYHGLHHPAFPSHDFYPLDQEPDDNYTLIPGKGYLQLHFDFNKYRPNEQQSAWPGAYPWHEGRHEYHQLPVKKRQQEHPHMDQPPTVGPVNEQAAPVGVSTYAKYAAPYGAINKTHPSDLLHYPLHGKLNAVNGLVAQHGYQAYLAGGRYGKPDLAKRNYTTGHLMVYDPTPDSGGDFKNRDYTEAWRKSHELAHALTYPQLNEMYGEGRRMGRLGHQRTPREAKRAVHWEWLAAHKQRELLGSVGVHIPDETFNKELNTVMHDAVHRAVTGRFTEPAGEGFRPHAHPIPLETALGMVDQAAAGLGLRGEHDVLHKSDRNLFDHKELQMADGKRDLDLPGTLRYLAQGLRKTLEKAEQDDGAVLGHTKSGKAVHVPSAEFTSAYRAWENSGNAHAGKREAWKTQQAAHLERHKDFTPDEHREAAKLHNDAATDHRVAFNKTKKSVHKRMDDAHTEAYHLHSREAEKGTQKSELDAKKPRHNKRGWLLGTCNDCGHENYVEPHGTTAECKSGKCKGKYTEHEPVERSFDRPEENRKSELDVPATLQYLAKGLKEMVDRQADVFLDMRCRELKKSAVGVCLMCGEADAPGFCVCLRKADDNKAWDPERKQYVKISGEKSIGTSSASHAAKPRLVGEEVKRFKEKMGVCQHGDCAKQSGHGGEHTVKKAESNDSEYSIKMGKKIRNFGGWYRHDTVHDKHGSEIGHIQVRNKGPALTVHHASGAGVVGSDPARLMRHHKEHSKVEKNADCYAKPMEKVAPPGEEKLVHKLKGEYGHDKAGKEKAYATAWSIHNEKAEAEYGGGPDTGKGMGGAGMAMAEKDVKKNALAGYGPSQPPPPAAGMAMSEETKNHAGNPFAGKQPGVVKGEDGQLKLKVKLKLPVKAGQKVEKAAADNTFPGSFGDARHKGDMVHHSKLTPKQKQQAQNRFPHQTPVSEHVGHNEPIGNEHYHYQIDRKGDVSGRRFLSRVGHHEGKLQNLKDMPNPKLPKSEPSMHKAGMGMGAPSAGGGGMAGSPKPPKMPSMSPAKTQGGAGGMSMKAEVPEHQPHPGASRLVKLPERPKGWSDLEGKVVAAKSKTKKAEQDANKKVPLQRKGTTAALEEGRENPDSVLPADKDSKVQGQKSQSGGNDIAAKPDVKIEKGMLGMSPGKTPPGGRVPLPGMTAPKENASTLVHGLAAAAKSKPKVTLPGHSAKLVQGLTKPVLGKADQDVAPKPKFGAQHMAAAKAKIGLPGDQMQQQRSMAGANKLMDQHLKGPGKVGVGSTLSLSPIPGLATPGVMLPGGGRLTPPPMGAGSRTPKSPPAGMQPLPKEAFVAPAQAKPKAGLGTLPHAKPAAKQQAAQKSEANTTDLRKSLGSCCLCGAAEHMGKCRNA